MTGRRQNIPFTEDAYVDTYRNHIESLKQTRNIAPIKTHQLLNDLFVKVR